MRVAGVMLAGGRSSRMGRTKAVIDIDGELMGSRVLSALRSAGCDPVIVYGGEPSELAGLDVAIEPDRHPGAGPVGAVAGVLHWLSTESTAGADRDADRDGDVDRDIVDGAVIVACDLPELGASVIRSLIDAAATSPGAVVVARTDRIEPLCAYWPSTMQPSVEAAFSGGTRALHRMIANVEAVMVDVPRSALRNVNTPADLG